MGVPPRFATPEAARAAAIEVIEDAIDPPEVQIEDAEIRCEGLLEWSHALASIRGHEAMEPEEPADDQVESWSVTARKPDYAVDLFFDREGELCAAGLYDAIDRMG